MFEQLVVGQHSVLCALSNDFLNSSNEKGLLDDTLQCIFYIVYFIYINYIGDKLLSLRHLFADDTSLVYSSQDETQIKYVINHYLHILLPH
jgi:hypothetical protein